MFGRMTMGQRLRLVGAPVLLGVAALFACLGAWGGEVEVAAFWLIVGGFTLSAMRGRPA